MGDQCGAGDASGEDAHDGGRGERLPNADGHRDEPSDLGYREDPSDSVVVTRTVRFVSPFVFVFGLYTMFHGTSSIGGGFQGGVVVAAVFVTIAFAFGVAQTAAWLDRSLLTWLVVTGVVVFAAVGGATVILGGTFLDLRTYPGKAATLYAIELVELAVGVTVAATIVVLFFEISGRFEAVRRSSNPDPDEGPGGWNEATGRGNER